MLRAWLARVRLFLQGGGVALSPDEYEALVNPEPGRVRAMLTCAHPKGCWSYCTGGYRYCLCCNRVRVRC